MHTIRPNRKGAILMKQLLNILLIVMICMGFSVLPAQASEPDQQTILIGILPEMNVFKQKQRFTLLGEYLSKKTGVKVTFTILSRYGNIIERFTQSKMDGAFFGSFTGALAIEKLGVIPIARPVNLDNSSTYHGYLFVRKDSGIKKIGDMKGKRMAYVERATTAGYIFPRALLKENGIADLDHFFQETFFAGSHDAAIYAVLDGTADVGVAKHSIYDRVKKDDLRVERELNILAQSPKVPSNGLCVRPGLDKTLQKKLKAALLGLNTDPDGERILKQFGALRFIDTTVQDYQLVNDLARKAGIDVKTYEYDNK